MGPWYPFQNVRKIFQVKKYFWFSPFTALPPRSVSRRFILVIACNSFSMQATSSQTRDCTPLLELCCSVSLVISLEPWRLAEDFGENSHHLAKHQPRLQARRGYSPPAVESEGSRFSGLSTQMPPIQFHDPPLFLPESGHQWKRVEVEHVFSTVMAPVQWDSGLDSQHCVSWSFRRWESP